MNNEWLIIFTVSACSILFAAGGTHINVIGGQKWLRRFGIPCLLCMIAVLSHVVWWKASIMAILLIVALSSGYGDNSSQIKKFFVFCMYSVPFFMLGWSLWIIATPILCYSIFLLSNWKPTSEMFFWKAAELIFGFLIGLTFVSCLK